MINKIKKPHEYGYSKIKKPHNYRYFRTKKPYKYEYPILEKSHGDIQDIYDFQNFGKL